MGAEQDSVCEFQFPLSCGKPRLLQNFAGVSSANAHCSVVSSKETVAFSQSSRVARQHSSNGLNLLFKHAGVCLHQADPSLLQNALCFAFATALSRMPFTTSGLKPVFDKSKLRKSPVAEPARAVLEVNSCAYSVKPEILLFAASPCTKTNSPFSFATSTRLFGLGFNAIVFVPGASKETCGSRCMGCCTFEGSAKYNSMLREPICFKFVTAHNWGYASAVLSPPSMGAKIGPMKSEGASNAASVETSIVICDADSLPALPNCNFTFAGFTVLAKVWNAVHCEYFSGL